MIAKECFPAFVWVCLGETAGLDMGELHKGFSEYLAALSTRPTMMNEMTDISAEKVKARGKTHWGNINGQHPALVWHFKKWMAGRVKETPETLHDGGDV